MSRISGSEFRREFEQASSAYEICWTYLTQIKTASVPVNPESFLDFQPRLAGAIASLSRLYAKLAQERRELVARKSELSVNWVTKRLQLRKRLNNRSLPV
jgi:hypothetical protein